MLRDTAFNENVAGWNTGSALDMSHLFADSSFDGDVSLWDTSQVTDFTRMFSGSPFNGDLSAWNTGSALSMDNMFDASSFNQDISMWDISSVTSFTRMFAGASLFSQDLCPWGDQISPTAIVLQMFNLTLCPDTNNPGLSLAPVTPLCHYCSTFTTKAELETAIGLWIDSGSTVSSCQQSRQHS